MQLVDKISGGDGQVSKDQKESVVALVAASKCKCKLFMPRLTSHTCLRHTSLGHNGPRWVCCSVGPHWRQVEPSIAMGMVRALAARTLRWQYFVMMRVLLTKLTYTQATHQVVF